MMLRERERERERERVRKRERESIKEREREKLPPYSEKRNDHYLPPKRFSLCVYFFFFQDRPLERK